MFNINTDFKLMGDQPKVINELTNSIISGNRYQTLKGVTGSGKTFCMGNIIQNVQKPTLIISHNKTLAAQLYSEFKELFPNNAVEYFVSHYKYFQPECYIPNIDKYIEKATLVNNEIEMMRQHCVQSLMSRNDVIVVASVSALFGLGDPDLYVKSKLHIEVGEQISREEILGKLIRNRYERTKEEPEPGEFRVIGSIIDIAPSIENNIIYKIEMFGDEIDSITQYSRSPYMKLCTLKDINIFSTSTYMVEDDRINSFCSNVETELNEVYNNFIKNGQTEYANRIYERTMLDLEYIREIGWCKGLESYQRYLSNRKPGEPPYTLIDFFPKDYLLFIDESHATIPQIKSVSNQNSTIKENLIRYGFRLPSCVDNRPVSFQEFEDSINQVVYVSATPSEFEINRSSVVTEQVIRPTGLLDPMIEVRPIKGQIDDIYSEINKVVEHKGKVIITVITKRMAEDLSDYLKELNVKACYVHSSIKTLERIEIINDFQKNKYDVLIGCNLLREGLSISNCELVIILDADKEGFLRNKTSLMQTIGRAARNVNGRAILYADSITKSMQETIDETNRHREIQMKYNKENNITPQSTKMKLITSHTLFNNDVNNINEFENKSQNELRELRKEYIKQMEYAAENLDFEEAVIYRDKIQDIDDLMEVVK